MTNWKNKLLAFLHDPPHKPRAVAAHEDQQQSFLNRLALNPEAFKQFDRSNDWQVTATVRLLSRCQSHQREGALPRLTL
jgi:hypothetical protein